MTLTNPKPTSWGYGEILTSAQMNEAGSQLPYAIDGNAGGTYTPTNPITVNGDGMVIDPLSSPQLDAVQAERHVASYRMEGAKESDELFDLVLLARSNTGYALTSNEVQVPEAGWYRIDFFGAIRSTGTSTGTSCRVGIYVNGSEVARATHTRSAADATHASMLAASHVEQITTPASEKISIVAVSTSGEDLSWLPAAVSLARLVIQRVA